MRLERRLHLGIRLDLDGNALRDLEVRLLAHRLHVAHELARIALGDELRRQRRLESDHDRTLRGDHEPRFRRARDDHVLGRQVDALDVERLRS